VKKQRAVFQRKNLCQNETSNLLGQLDTNFLGGLSSRIQFVIYFFLQNLSFKTFVAFAFGKLHSSPSSTRVIFVAKATHVLNYDKFCWKKLDQLLYYTE
jgi:hypothetical protein